MKVITFGFSAAKSKFAVYSRLIRWAQGTEFSHVYMKIHWTAADQDLIYQASGLSVNFEPQWHFDTHARTVQEFPIEISDECYAKFTKALCAQLSKPYSIKGVLGLAIRLFAAVFKRDINNPFPDGHDSEFCSKLAVYLVQQSGAFKLTLDPENTGPKEFFEALQAYGQ